MIIISNPPSVISSFNGHAPFNSSYSTAGLKFAKRFNSFRIFKSPASGRLFGSNWYHGETFASPPIEPIKTASHDFASATVSSVNGIPCTSIEAPPSNNSLYLYVWPYTSPTLSNTFIASSTISGPIPSPLIIPTFNSIYLFPSLAKVYRSNHIVFLFTFQPFNTEKCIFLEYTLF